MRSDAGDQLLLERVNQKLPSAPIVIAKGWLPLRMGKLKGSNARRQRLGGGGAYAERDHGEAETKFGCVWAAEGGEYRPG